ncbi:hypothetical protein DWB77_05499 [Streptomyces hundungensis]|uniref:Lipoprotein n=1 Tax=Streptomyces hundungensis TaxID=1077946 RepID=A0A387HM03_9ACTN|nr:hypothetical protein [Streptomyces hundungensis]AYG83303.1 hypothetical protein DWB77_05499 [Streptomyces hundungensis]
MRNDARVVFGVVVALAVVTGCGSSSPQAPKTASGTLEQLAARADCRPVLSTDSTELRRANCTTADGRYVLATFATDRGQREWINEAKDYGGAYLVGRKWVAVGEQSVVTALRGRLGGSVETGTMHSGH